RSRTDVLCRAARDPVRSRLLLPGLRGARVSGPQLDPGGAAAGCPRRRPPAHRTGAQRREPGDVAGRKLDVRGGPRAGHHLGPGEEPLPLNQPDLGEDQRAMRWKPHARWVVTASTAVALVALPGAAGAGISRPQIYLSWHAPYGTPGASDQLTVGCDDTTRADPPCL